MANFKADFGQAYPGLPDGYIGRYYERGVNHYLHTHDTAAPQDLSWPEGDRYRAAYESLITVKAAREAAGTTPGETVDEGIEDNIGG